MEPYDGFQPFGPQSPTPDFSTPGAPSFQTPGENTQSLEYTQTTRQLADASEAIITRRYHLSVVLFVLTICIGALVSLRLDTITDWVIFGVVVVLAVILLVCTVKNNQGKQLENPAYRSFNRKFYGMMNHFYFVVTATRIIAHSINRYNPSKAFEPKPQISREDRVQSVLEPVQVLPKQYRMLKPSEIVEIYFERVGKVQMLR